jgi:uncharacterized membrane protein YbhN (UPF0104 family)
MRRTPGHSYLGSVTGQRIATTAVLLAGAASFALAVPGVDGVVAELRDVDPGWIALAIGLELASCLSFVAIFRLFFDQVPAPVGRRLAWTAMGSGALLPAGGAGGLAVSGWLMHNAGMQSGQVVRRASGLFFLTSAASVAAMGIGAALLLSGLADGPHDLVRAGLPFAGAAAVVVATMALARNRRLQRPKWRELVEGVREAEHAIAKPHSRLAGAIGYLVFDVGVLWAAFAAVGHAPPGVALALAYIVGYIANAVPVPAGLAVLDSGLAGALVLYGAPATEAAAAVLVYHAIAFWVPAVGGVLSYFLLRRDLVAPRNIVVPRETVVSA